MTLALDGVTFRWDGEELLLITATDQKRLTGSSAARLLDFLMAIQQDLYTAEQARELPTWAHPSRQFVNGQVGGVQPPRLTEGTRRDQEEKP